MRFLIDASLPRSTASPIRQRGHDALDVRDVGPSLALDPAVAAYAKAHEFALVTADFDFADIRVYPPEAYHGIVVIDRPVDSSIAEVMALVDRFLDSPGILSALTGRLIIVDARRIRVRPALSDPGV